MNFGPDWTALAAFLNVTPERLLFTTNVSAAINLVASSLELPEGGEILMPDPEYPAMVWCMERLARWHRCLPGSDQQRQMPTIEGQRFWDSFLVIGCRV
jgi:DNA-binding transcriptional MocR family regulator